MIVFFFTFITFDLFIWLSLFLMVQKKLLGLLHLICVLFSAAALHNLDHVCTLHCNS